MVKLDIICKHRQEKHRQVRRALQTLSRNIYIYSSYSFVGGVPLVNHIVINARLPWSVRLSTLASFVSPLPLYSPLLFNSKPFGREQIYVISAVEVFKERFHRPFHSIPLLPDRARRNVTDNKITTLADSTLNYLRFYPNPTRDIICWHM